MTGPSDNPKRGTGFDRVLSFTIPESNARGRVVRLGPVLDTVLSAHDYPQPIRHLLAEALVLTALLGSLLKEGGSQLTLQAQSDEGIVDLLVCDFRDAEVRGYVRFDAERLAEVGGNSSLEKLFGEGYLAITFDLPATDERYQGIVPLEGASLSEVCEAYFEKSEQVPTVIRLGIRGGSGSMVAGGLLVQYFPEGEEGQVRLHVQADHPEWEHIAVLSSSIRHDELVDADLELEQLVWRLFHQEGQVRVLPMAKLTRGCRCTLEYYQNVLSKFPEAERAEMRDADGTIPVDCAFCSKIFMVPA